MAHAADPGTHGTRGVSAPAVDLTKATSQKFKTYHSSADKSVKKDLGAKNKGAATLQAEGVSAGNPDLNMVLNATPISAHGFKLDTEILSAPNVSLTLTVDWGDGSPKDVTPAGGPGVVNNQHTYAELGEYQVTVTVTDTANAKEVTNVLENVGTVGSEFTPYGPTRLLDTREGIGAPVGPVPGRGITRVKVGGNGNIPQGVTAVVLNVTVTNTRSNGFITAYPEGSDRPNSSNVNFHAGHTIPNLVVVPVGKNGYVDLYNGAWNAGDTVDLIADVTGFFTQSSASGYKSLDPVRFVDTREGLGTKQGQVPARGSFTTQIAGMRGVPSGITAVALNVTVTNPKSTGYLTVLPGGGAIPNASNLNFTYGQTLANSVIVPVSSDGKITVFNGTWNGATDVVIDVVGAYSKAESGAYMPIAPERLFDTRDPQDPVYGPMESDSYIYAPLSTKRPSITAFVTNATVTNTKSPGYLTVAPDPNTIEQYKNKTAGWPNPPFVSNLNWIQGDTVPNLVQASTGNNGIIDFWNKGWGNTDLIVDLFGFYDTK
ncbi:PKD domain-containing protein [Streptomyces sp. NPDC059447]|uniref:PKD domain-containing protein n=1 Tax=Streptomyces sp. NPDC059447 TaxID=3346834 RepID=UPI0036991579